MDTIILPRNELFDTGLNMATGEQAVICESYAYHLDQVTHWCSQNRRNLDWLLTRRIVGGLAAKPPKRSALVMYEPFNELFRLSVCSKGLKVPLAFLAEMPGYMECGQDAVRENGRPFMYWDGLNAYRVYQRPDGYTAGAQLVCDFGSLFGLLTAIADADTYARVRDEPDYAYSAVPQAPDEIVTVDGRKLVLTHAFFRFG